MKPPDFGGLENFEVIYFQGAESFKILGWGYPLGGVCIS